MSATSLYRIAAVLFLLFALGHTVGFLKFKPPTPEGIAVRESMTNVHFQVRGRDYSYGGFYRGFGLFNSVYLLFSALLAWHLANLAAHAPHAIGPVGWAFCLVMVATLVLCWAYFNAVAVAFSAVLAGRHGWSMDSQQQQSAKGAALRPALRRPNAARWHPVNKFASPGLEDAARIAGNATRLGDDFGNRRPQNRVENRGVR